MCHFCLWSDRSHNPVWAISTSYSTSHFWCKRHPAQWPPDHLPKDDESNNITRIQVRRMPNFVPIACQISCQSAEKWKSYSDLKLSWLVPCPGLWVPGARPGRRGDAGSRPLPQARLPAPPRKQKLQGKFFYFWSDLNQIWQAYW